MELMGPSLPNGHEPTMNWRTQLHSVERERIVSMIIETLKKQHLPFSGPEGINDHRKIAFRFEEKVFSNAANLTGYLRDISHEMMSIETTVSDAADSSISIPAAYNCTPLNSMRIILSLSDLWSLLLPANVDDLGLAVYNSVYVGRLMENNSWRHFSLPYREPAMDTGDWRTQQPPDSRQKNVNNLMETLKKHVPYSGQEGIDKLMRIAVSFEELIFNTATNQVDYFRKISLIDADYGRGQLSSIAFKGHSKRPIAFETFRAIPYVYKELTLKALKPAEFKA